MKLILTGLIILMAGSACAPSQADRIAQLTAMGGVECGIQAMLLREGKPLDEVRSSAYVCLNDHWKIIGYPKELYQTKEVTK
jgi:hypothetical protein